MRLSGTRVYYRPTPPKMPPGLVELMEGLTKEVLKQNPSDIYSFCAGHMQHLLEIRDGVSASKRIMTIEEKICYVQEKMRQKAEKRREFYDKKLLLQHDKEASNLQLVEPNVVEVQELSALKQEISDNYLIPATKFSNVQYNLPDDKVAPESYNVLADETAHSEDHTAKQLESLSDAEILPNKEIQVTPNYYQSDQLGEVVTEPNISNIAEVENAKDRKFSDTTSHITLEIPQNTTANKIEMGSSNKDVTTESVNILVIEGMNSKDNNAYKHEIDLNETHEKDDDVQNVAPNQIHLANPVISKEINRVAKVGNASGLDLEVMNVTEVDERFSIHHTDNEIVDKNNTVPDMNQQKVLLSTNDITNNGYIIEDYNAQQVEYETQASIAPVVEVTAQQLDNTVVQEYGNDIKTLENYNYSEIYGAKYTKDLTEHEEIKVDNDVTEGTSDIIQEPSDNNETKLANTDANHEKHENDQTTKNNVLEFQFDLPTSDTDCDVDTLVTDDMVNDVQHVKGNVKTTQINNILSEPTDKKEIINEFQTSTSTASDINETDKTEDEITSNQDESVLNSDNESSSMNLETAAITIQKVFRSFLFKSRASTFEDSVNEDQSYVDGEHKNKGESDFPVASVLNAERRQLGLTRMDTVLQTVNEEKSLSLSTDDSSTLSSAATIIQAHVRGYLVRNKLNSNKTSSNSLAASNSNEPSLTSIDGDNEQNKNNKTVLNIHIVPEGGDYLSRDESLITSVDLSLDSSPPSSINLHPLGYDKSERRKQLKREDAIQSVSPPSNNSGKLSEDVESVKDLPLNDQITSDQVDLNKKPIEANLNIETNEVVDKIPPEAHEENKAEVHNNESKINHLAIDILKEKRKSLSKMSSDERDVVTPSGEDNIAESKLLHSGEFHDVVLPTEVSRRDTSVVSGE